ncbi:MAG: hypothetical protein Q8N74_10050, partial [Sulfuricella sp.]|nr:hypothetical protein [Sulfuricella sp.]
GGWQYWPMLARMGVREINLKTAIASADYADFHRFSECYRFFVSLPMGEPEVFRNQMIYLR